MKISTLSTDNAIDVLVRITEPMMNIATDDEIFKVFSNKVEAKDIQTKGQQFAAFARIVTSMVPLLLKTHKDDTCEIIAAINDMSVEEVKGMNILKTMVLARECIMDKDLIAFFKSCVSTEKSGA